MHYVIETGETLTREQIGTKEAHAGRLLAFYVVLEDETDMLPILVYDNDVKQLFKENPMFFHPDNGCQVVLKFQELMSKDHLELSVLSFKSKSAPGQIRYRFVASHDNF